MFTENTADGAASCTLFTENTADRAASGTLFTENTADRAASGTLFTENTADGAASGTVPEEPCRGQPGSTGRRCSKRRVAKRFETPTLWVLLRICKFPSDLQQ